MNRLRGLATRLLAEPRVRFLLVGAVNTVVGYAFYALYYSLWGQTIGPLGSLFAAHLTVSTGAFVLYRRFVFRVSGHLLRDYLRFQSVYVLSFAANAVLLWVTVTVLGWNPYLAQALVLVVVTVSSYLGHRFFSFRRSATPGEETADHAFGTHDVPPAGD